MNAKRTMIVAGLVAAMICALIGVVYAGESLRAMSLNSAIEAAGAQWQAGETHLSAMTEQQRKGLLGLIEPDLGDHSKIALAPLPQAATLPSSLDWRNNNGNWVTSVKDQGQCGSCWAFATTAALESYTLRKNNTPLDNKTTSQLDLSEQVTLSCSGAGSCAGGYLSYASDFLRNTGDPVESCYPYTGSNGSCASACGNKAAAAYSIASWQYVSTKVAAGNVDALRNALNTYGPLVTTMAVYYDFFFYTKGIYSHVSGPYEGGHAILLVGYNDAQQYFIAKNSWSQYFGENGYFRIAYSEVTGASGFGSTTIAYLQPTAFTVTPTTITVAAGNTGTGAISGGQVPYSASTANAQVATASVSGATLAITGVSTGTTTVTVKDSSGNSKTVSVTVTAPLKVNPTSISVTAGKTATAAITSGTAAYAVLSSSASIATASVSGSTITITGVATGSATITVTDKNNLSTTISVTVTAPLAVSPTSLTLATGKSGLVSVTGGAAPYKLTAISSQSVNASLNGVNLTVNGLSAGTATVTVADKNNATAVLNVTVTAPLSASPMSIRLAAGGTATATISGGLPTYTVTSGNTKTASVSLSGNIVTIKGVSAGTVSITVLDQNDGITGIGVTVTAALSVSPTSASVTAGKTTTAIISGGNSASYKVSSSNTSIATVSLNGANITITGVAKGTATITVTDANQTQVTLSITVK